MGTKAKRSARKQRKASRRERAHKLLRIQSGTLTLYTAYIVVLVRLAVILFHGDLPRLG